MEQIDIEKELDIAYNDGLKYGFGKGMCKGFELGGKAMLDTIRMTVQETIAESKSTMIDADTFLAGLDTLAENIKKKMSENGD